jgi:hypothetical protein
MTNQAKTFCRSCLKYKEIETGVYRTVGSGQKQFRCASCISEIKRAKK